MNRLRPVDIYDISDILDISGITDIGDIMASIRKLVTFTQEQRAAIDKARGQVPFATFVRDAAVSAAAGKPASAPAPAPRATAPAQRPTAAVDDPPESGRKSVFDMLPRRMVASQRAADDDDGME